MSTATHHSIRKPDYEIVSACLCYVQTVQSRNALIVDPAGNCSAGWGADEAKLTRISQMRATTVQGVAAKLGTLPALLASSRDRLPNDIVAFLTSIAGDVSVLTNGGEHV